MSFRLNHSRIYTRQDMMNMKTLSALTAILLAMIRFPIGAAGADKDQNTGHNLPRPAR